MSDGHLSFDLEASRNAAEDSFDSSPRKYLGDPVESTSITSESFVPPNDVDRSKFRTEQVETVSAKTYPVAHVEINAGEFRRRWLLRILILTGIFVAYLAAVVFLIRYFLISDVVDNGVPQSLLKVVDETSCDFHNLI